MICQNLNHATSVHTPVATPVDHVFKLPLQSRQARKAGLDVHQMRARDFVGRRTLLIGIILQPKQCPDGTDVKSQLTSPNPGHNVSAKPRPLLQS